jgi:hypothetical protein
MPEKKITASFEVRLEQAEGSVTVTSGGKAAGITSRMKLYGGHAVATGARAKAYLSVDESRVITLGENAEITVKAASDGKKLEVEVTRGDAQFGAVGSLKKDEKGNIKISTMVTGIRG